MATVAPETTAPEGSVTCPRSVPADWAAEEMVSAATTMMARTAKYFEDIIIGERTVFAVKFARSWKKGSLGSRIALAAGRAQRPRGKKRSGTAGRCGQDGF